MNTLRLRAARAALALAASAATMVPLGAWADDRGDDDARTGAAWWQWAFSAPTAANPLADADGSNCMVGQRGKTWYLAGSFNGGSVSRKCTIPQGVKLFFPVANSVWFDNPGVCGQVGSIPVAQLRASAAQFVDSLTAVRVTGDSRTVRSVRRLRSEVFPLAFPADNLFAPLCVNDGGFPAGVYPRSVDDGWYAEVDDLSVGTHMLQISASAPGFDLSINYTLTVKARDKP